MPKKESGIEIAAAIAQCQGQHNPLLCLSASHVVAEPHHVDLMVLSPQGWEHCNSHSDG